MILRPASDNAQFVRLVIVNRFPNPDLDKIVAPLKMSCSQ